MHQEARELKSFLDAIAADPRDIQTRRVFADWLEDHDEPELADEQRKFNLEKYDAQQRLKRFAEQYANGDYEGLLDGIRKGQYCFSNDFYRENMDEEFWEDVALILDMLLTDEDVDIRSGSFRCAC